MSIDKRFDKYLTARELMKILKPLSDDTGIRLYPNDVKNLAVVKNGKFIGYIDFLDGSLTYFTPEEMK